MNWRQGSWSGWSREDNPRDPSTKHAGQRGSSCVAVHTVTTRVRTREATQ